MDQSHWEGLAEDLRGRAAELHAARESGLTNSRALIQLCSRSIKHVHRRQFEEAKQVLEKAKSLANSIRTELKSKPQLYYAGYVQDAEKELVEAAAVWAIVHNENLPSCDELGVDMMSYLNGMGEAASEVRRFALDELRDGRESEATRILGAMQAIYDELVTFDYSDGMTGGLRRTCDALRAVVERTRSDLTLTSVQKQLVKELQRHM